MRGAGPRCSLSGVGVRRTSDVVLPPTGPSLRTERTLGLTPCGRCSRLSPRVGLGPPRRTGSRDWSPSNKFPEVRVMQEEAQGRASPWMMGRLGREKGEEANFFLDRIPPKAPWSPAEGISESPTSLKLERKTQWDEKKRGEFERSRRPNPHGFWTRPPLSSPLEVPTAQVGPEAHLSPTPGSEPKEKQQQA